MSNKPRPPLLRTFYNKKKGLDYEISNMDNVTFALSFDENRVIKSVHLRIDTYGKGKVQKKVIIDLESGGEIKSDI